MKLNVKIIQGRNIRKEYSIWRRKFLRAFVDWIINEMNER